MVCHTFFHAVCHCTGDVFLCLVPVKNTAVQEDFSLLFKFLQILLCDATSHNVRATEGVACHLLCNLHNLLLIDNTSVGHFKHFFKKWVGIFHLVGVLFALQEVVKELHRTGTIH